MTLWLIALNSLAAAAQAPAPPAPSASILLVTPEEAARPEVPERHLRGLFPGPAILMVSPTERAALQPLRSPIRLTFSFAPRNEAKVVLSSVKIVYVKSPPADLTARVLPSISESGIDLSNISLPAGRHTFRMSVVDTNGNLGAATYTITVAK